MRKPTHGVTVDANAMMLRAFVDGPPDDGMIQDRLDTRMRLCPRGEGWATEDGRALLCDAAFEAGYDAAIIRARRLTMTNNRKSLREQRDDLLLDRAAALDALAAARDRAFSADTGRGWDEVRKANEAVRVAEQALAEFDAAHPEVVAQIAAENAKPDDYWPD